MYSVFELFKIGIGPSSSHTVGPMRAARAFLQDLEKRPEWGGIESLTVELYGSLALTGRGHGTDKAILLGLEGEDPAEIDPDTIPERLERIRREGTLRLLGVREIPFSEAQHLVFHGDALLPRHSNGMRFTAGGPAPAVRFSRDFYSIGGGFILRAEDPDPGAGGSLPDAPYPYRSAAELLTLARRQGLSIPELVLANECSAQSVQSVEQGLDRLWRAFQSCVRRGLTSEGTLPGGLHVVRRAPRLYQKLQQNPSPDGFDIMDWVNAYALAVNEENAGGGRVVTAPTNGAAGIVPAVLHYYRFHVKGGDEAGVRRFLLAAGGICILYKINASISGAEMGCQGEVGVACSMAAAGLAAALGGNNAQIEHAAEIGMEHNLGLTCDPVGGLVQIPCIERNAIGAVKAINAQRLACGEDGEHRVSLDQVIQTMRQTGLDMQSQYKETSRGGLAVNVVEC
jgi:L-serine dehydratase